MLDDFIGKPLLAIKGGKRHHEHYGIVSDIRDKPYGFEYRTPPSFIGKKDLFEGVIAVAYCLAKTWRNTVLKRFVFKYNDTPSPDDYRNLSGYKKYKDKIEDFINYRYNDKSIVERNTLAAWKIR